MPISRNPAAWASYLAAYHGAHPGITEDLLAAARDPAGRTVYDWLIEAVPDGGMVVDLACGSAPVLRSLGGARAVSVDRSAGELARARRSCPRGLFVRADATALPLADGVADVVTCSMALMVLHPVEAVLAEVARLLRPGGVFVATVPERSSLHGEDPVTADFTRILAQLGEAGSGYPDALDPPSVAARFASAGLDLTGDTHALFNRRISTDLDAELVVRSFYAPDASAEAIAEAVEMLRRRARLSPVDIAYRIRRLVAVSAVPVPAVSAVRKLSMAIRERGGDIEAAGRIPPDVVSDLRGAGVFGMWMPSELGGAEAPPEDVIDVIETLGAADGSTGWCAAVAVGTGALAAYLPEAGAREIFATPSVITAGSFNPAGRAVAVEAGVRVSGRWGFASGSQHCDWLFGGCLDADPSGQPLSVDDRPVARLVFGPAASATIIDTWQVCGLRATGSHDFEVDRVEVPLDHTMAFAFSPWPGGAMWRMPPMSLFFAPMAAVPLGIARAAIDELMALAQDKTPYRSSRRLAERDVVQSMLAKAEAAVRSAHAFLLEAMAEVWTDARSGAEISIRQRALVRLAIVNASRAGMDAVDLCFQAAGSTALFVENPMQRFFRDVHAAGQHVVLAFPGWETVGRVLLGLDPDTPLL